MIGKCPLNRPLNPSESVPYNANYHIYLLFHTLIANGKFGKCREMNSCFRIAVTEGLEIESGFQFLKQHSSKALRISDHSSPQRRQTQARKLYRGPRDSRRDSETLLSMQRPGTVWESQQEGESQIQMGWALRGVLRRNIFGKSLEKSTNLGIRSANPSFFALKSDSSKTMPFRPSGLSRLAFSVDL